MRRALVAVALVALASPAAAGGRPRLADLPEVTVPAVLDPGAAPASIAKDETVTGIAASSRDPSHSFVAIETADRRCVKAGADLTAAGADAGNFLRADQATAFVQGKQVLPVRTERLVVSDAGAALEIVDAWVDPATLGVRAAATTRVPLVTLARGPAGFAAYGYRSGDALWLVLPASSGQMFYRDAGGVFSSVGCDHVRTPLRVDAGEAATMSAALRLDAPGAAAPRAPSFAQKGRPALTIPARVSPQQAPAPPRFVRVSASASRTRADREPVISVVATWADEAPAPSVPVSFDDELAVPQAPNPQILME